MTCGLCGASAQQKLQAWLLGLRSPLSLQCRYQLTRPHRSTPTCKAACSPPECQAPIYKDTWNQEWVTHGSLGAPAVSTPSLKVINPRSGEVASTRRALEPDSPQCLLEGPKPSTPCSGGSPFHTCRSGLCGSISFTTWPCCTKMACESPSHATCRVWPATSAHTPVVPLCSRCQERGVSEAPGWGPG